MVSQGVLRGPTKVLGGVRTHAQSGGGRHTQKDEQRNAQKGGMEKQTIFRTDRHTHRYTEVHIKMVPT